MLKRLIAVVLLFSTLAITAPISAADLNTHKSLGSVSGSGTVFLRGIEVSQEGTIFPGDRLAVGTNGAARVTLVNGGKIVLERSTDLTFVQSGQLQLNQGNASFNTRNTALDILAGNYRIKGDRALSGNVAFIGSEYIGLRVAAGTATVENLKTRQTYKVSAGQERLFSLVTAEVKSPIAQLASALPGPLPSIPPAPQTSSSPNNGLSRSGWIAVFALVGGAAASIAYLATNGNKDQSAVLNRQKVLQAAANAASTASQATAAASTVVTTANQVNAAIAAATNVSPAVRATLTNQATAISSQATATQQQIASLNTQLVQLQAQLVNVTDQATVNSITAQINTVIANLNQQDATLNQEIAALNALITQAQQAGVPNVPTVTITPIPPVPGAIASQFSPS